MRRPAPTALSYAALMDYDHRDYGLDAYLDGKFKPSAWNTS